jgi:hypothetical protein
MSFNEPLEMSRRAETPAEEVDLLHKRLAERQERMGINVAERSERERVAAQELKAYKGESSEDVLHPDLIMNEQEVDRTANEFLHDGEKQLDDLVSTLVKKGIKNTLAVADKMGNPHLSDDLHRFLIQYLSEGMTVPGLKEGSPLFRALHMTLFEITLPDIAVANKEQEFSKLVVAMEQFYSGMLSIKGSSSMQNYFTIEIALESHDDKIVFYVSVPNSKVTLFEKHMMATFPSAQMLVSKRDYNPFNESGVSVGSVAKLNKQPILPIKTYEDFSQDPLNVILGVFTKLKKFGEGSAIQFVITPVGDEINKKYQDALKEVKKGVTIDRALEHTAIKVVRDIVGTIFGDEKKKEKQEEEALKKVDAGEVEMIMEKISSPIVNVVIRIVGSAETEERAIEIVNDVESAFNQFSNEPANNIGFLKVSKGNMRQLLNDFSFRLFTEKYAIPLNLKELTTIFHFPVMKTESTELKQSKMVTAPAPQNMRPSGVFLGVNSHRGGEQNVYLTPDDRLRHFYVIGQTGTGKTTLIKDMVIQDIMSGEGVCYIDPHGTDIEDILNAVPAHRVKDVIYFDPGDVERPLGLNMLEYDRAHPEQKTFVVNEMLSIFNKLFDMKTAGGPAFEQYFRNSALLVLEHPESGCTLMEIGRVMGDKAFRDMKLSHCKNPIITQFWQNAEKTTGDQSLANFVPYITNKFDVFLSNDIMRSIVLQETSSFNFRDVMDNRKILLVNLAKGRLGEINSHLIGLILVGKILMAALSRVDSMGKMPADFYLYIDEFQNVTTDSIAAILSEARKYRLGLIVAHQFIAQLDENIRNAVFGNVGSMAVFRVGADDAEFIENQFAPTFSQTDLMNTPNRNAYVKMIVNGSPAKPFNIATQAPVKGDPEVGMVIKHVSRQLYGRNKEMIDAAIMEKYTRKIPVSVPVKPTPISPPKPVVPPIVPLPVVSSISTPPTPPSIKPIVTKPVEEIVQKVPEPVVEKIPEAPLIVPSMKKEPVVQKTFEPLETPRYGFDMGTGRVPVGFEKKAEPSILEIDDEDILVPIKKPQKTINVSTSFPKNKVEAPVAPKTTSRDPYREVADSL